VAGELREFEQHLKGCGECRREFELLMRHSTLLQALRPAETVEPVPGFHARVLDRIETQRRTSFWYPFLQPSLMRQLAYSGIVTLLLLGAYIFTESSERSGRVSAPEAEIVAVDQAAEMGQDRSQDRDTILVTLATYED
jgi:hypothetical protein